MTQGSTAPGQGASQLEALTKDHRGQYVTIEIPHPRRRMGTGGDACRSHTHEERMNT